MVCHLLPFAKVGQHSYTAWLVNSLKHRLCHALEYITVLNFLTVFVIILYVGNHVKLDPERVHWGKTPFRVNDDREIRQPDAKYDPEFGQSDPIICQVCGKLTNFRVILDPEWSLAPMDPFRVAKLFIPLQFRTPVRTHLHTANQRPRVLICIQPIHRGWFNPRYILVRPHLLLSTARSAVGKATCSTALHCLFSGCEFKSSCWLFFFGYNKMGNNGVYSVRGDTQMMK